MHAEAQNNIPAVFSVINVTLGPSEQTSGAFIVNELLGLHPPSTPITPQRYELPQHGNNCQGPMSKTANEKSAQRDANTVHWL